MDALELGGKGLHGRARAGVAGVGSQLDALAAERVERPAEQEQLAFDRSLMTSSARSARANDPQ
ncbi:MAG: hypothetical protein M3Y48_07860 [Actinomycetota bacterium]|nr:hypothetical protein [Actinomycetota bacterium]